MIRAVISPGWMLILALAQASVVLSGCGLPFVETGLGLVLGLTLTSELLAEAGEYCVNQRLFALGEMLLKVGRLAHAPWLLLPGKLGIMMWLAESNQIQLALTEQQKYAEALSISQSSIRLVRKRAGEGSTHYIEELINRSFVLSRMGYAEEAEEVAAEALALINCKQTRSQSETHVLCLALNNLGVVAINQGRVEDAANYFDRSLQLNRAFLSPNNSSLIVAYCNIGYTLSKANQHAQAERVCRVALDMLANAPANPMLKATIMNNLGDVLREQGKLKEAQEYLLDALSIRRKLHRSNHPYLAYSYHNLGRLRLAQNRILEAEEYFRLAMGIRERNPGANLCDLRETLGEYQLVLRKLDRQLEAEGLVEAHNLIA